jgi:Protein of unknown function (DUF1559)
MGRNDDDDLDDDRPRKRRPRRDDDFDNDAEDRPRARRRPRDDDDFEDRPRSRRRRDDDDFDDRPRKKSSSGGAILLIVALVLIVLCGGGGTILYFAFEKVSTAKTRMMSMNNLKQIGIGALNFESANRHYPGNTYTAEGKPLLSWRVHLLPYVEEDNLYLQFKLDEPWDGPNNIRLLNQMPRVYRKPDDPAGETNTFYQGFGGTGTVRGLFSKSNPSRPYRNTFMHSLRLTDVKDGVATTVLCIEAGSPVEWTKPDDLDVDPAKPFPPFGGAFPKLDAFNLVTVDGSAKAVKRSTLPEHIRMWATPAGGEPAPLP